MRHLYNALFYLAMPLVLLRMLLRSRRAPAYRRRLGERFARFATDFDPARPAIWVHAVSLGETLAAAPLIESLLRDYPDYRLVVTTTTPTGSRQVQSLFGERVFHVYAPWDLPGTVCRFLRRVQPRLLLIMETELWPNLLHYSAASGCRIILANARLSQRSSRGYARLGGLTRAMLQRLDCVACQSVADGGRFLSLGLPEAALQVTGNIKFDLEIDAGLRARAAVLREAYAADQRPILLAASTHPGEEEQVLAAFAVVRRTLDNCLLVLVPRHPERFEQVYALAAAGGWRVLRRSQGGDPGAAVDIVLGDTMGELALLFSVASVALIGGSLVPHGGHNTLEAAAWGVPVVSGPHLFNFAAVSELLLEADAMIALRDPGDLGTCLSQLLGDPQRCRAMGAAGQRVVADNRGARKRLLQLVAQQLADG